MNLLLAGKKTVIATETWDAKLAILITVYESRTQNKGNTLGKKFYLFFNRNLNPSELHHLTFLLDSSQKIVITDPGNELHLHITSPWYLPLPWLIQTIKGRQTFRLFSLAKALSLGTIFKNWCLLGNPKLMRHQSRIIDWDLSPT